MATRIKLLTRRTARRAAASLGAVVIGLGALSGTVQAASERDPAYASARAAGQVGERIDGYLGIVGNASPSLRALVDDINIKRKAVYSERAQAKSSTVEEYAFTAGCLAIARTSPGEKYQGPDGSWLTRGPGAPVRDSRCP